MSYECQNVYTYRPKSAFVKSWFGCASELLNSADVKTNSCFHLWPKRSQLTWAVNRIPWSCGSEGLCHVWNLLEPLKHSLRPEMPREPLCWHNISTPWMYKAPNKRTQIGSQWSSLGSSMDPVMWHIFCFLTMFFLFHSCQREAYRLAEGTVQSAFYTMYLYLYVVVFSQ